ncbi:VanZ family protein [Bacillus solitudinis]|uniref:VanZ family protein n=1 Tax=Bacillus solitudinis TaxID=2014074 RepID=UPI000C247CE2|nr:VanZ family protein [Bacillus solitudinis]
MKYKKLKWLAIFVSFLYLVFVYLKVIENGSLIYDYFTVFGNWIVITVLTVWFVNKSTVQSTFDFLILCAFILYLFVLHQYVSFVDIGYYFTQEYTGNYHVQYDRINLIPFNTIWHVLTLPVFVPVMIIQVLGNLVLLTPFAFALLSLGITKGTKKTVFVIFLLSLGIETFQFVLSFIASAYRFGEGRAIDVDDLILNTLGSLIGVLFYKLYRRTLFFLNNTRKNKANMS